MLRQPTEQLRNEVQDLQQADASIGRDRGAAGANGRASSTDPARRCRPDRWRLSSTASPSATRTDAPVLRDVSVRLEPGRVLGVVGRTGSGKTTLTRLLPRFHDPQAGAVRLGGVDLRDVRLAAVRARIGLVTQEVHLFDASVRDNLTLFDDDRAGRADRRRARHAWASATGCARCRTGWTTPLGAGGAGLSAGQAQVLACARIFLRDPDIVILDEASSRLDPATERLVHAALGRLLRRPHRRSSLPTGWPPFAFADDILVLEEGRVREHGPRLALAADPDLALRRLLRVAAEEVAR